MPDPSLKQNGFADNTAPSDNMFYRIFIMFEGGNYTSTKSKRPTVDSLGLADAYNTGNKKNVETNLPPNFTPSGFIPSICQVGCLQAWIIIIQQVIQLLAHPISTSGLHIPRCIFQQMIKNLTMQMTLIAFVTLEV